MTKNKTNAEALEIRCAICGDTWPIPGSMSAESLLAVANHAAYHECRRDSDR